jgi:microcin C transport system substrate-binding protein
MNRFASFAALLVCGTFFSSAAFAEGTPAHGFAVLGALKYPGNFKHFDYVNPKAPKGGRIKLWYQGSYDNLNPFILKGHEAAGSNPFGVSGRVLTFESLMTASNDEAGAYYGLIAESVELPDDRQSVTFNLRDAARWHDGTQITADDVVFSFNTLKEKGHPAFRVLLRDVVSVEKLGPLRVHYSFAEGAHTRDLPPIVAGLPVISKAWYTANNFSATTLTPPLGSVPDMVDKVDAGRSITYARVKKHWGRKLPVYTGRWNFDRITWDYYRDRDIALEALFAGKIDFREDDTSRDWATKYKDVKAVKDGRLIRQSVPDNSPSGFQAFFLNTRRAKFEDRGVRKALGLLFDFKWTNRNLFYGAYKRTYSIFQNSDMEAHGVPSPEERALLDPYSKFLPWEIIGPAYRPVPSDGSGKIRGQLRAARRLFKNAGWTIQDGVLKNADGRPLTIEFLSVSRAFERIVMPYIRNLEKIGIRGSFRLVEPAQYQRRLQTYDFDVITVRNGSSLIPGVSLRNVWHSDVVNVPGAQNYAGLSSPVVDKLIEKTMAATSREDLLTATRALDRVVMYSHVVIPQWYKASHNIAYWNMFGRPKVKPKYARGVLDTWWVDRRKANKLKR